MPDGQNILNANAGGNLPEVRLAIGSGNATAGLPGFTAGMRLDAEVVKDLGNGFYEIEVTVKTEGLNENPDDRAEEKGAAEKEGDGQTHNGGRRMRLVVESKIPLPVGGRVTFAVRTSGEQPVLEVVETSPTPAQDSSSPTAINPQAEQFRQSVVEVLLPLTDAPPGSPSAPATPPPPLPPEAGPPAPNQAASTPPPPLADSLLEAFPPGSQPVLTIDARGEVYLWPAQGTAVSPVPVTGVLLTSQEPAGTAEAAPAVEKINAEADLIRLLQSTPPERRISLNIQSAQILQDVLLQIALPATEGAGEDEVVTIRGVIKIPLPAAPGGDSGRVENPPPVLAALEPLAAGTHIPANIAASDPGKLVLRTRVKSFEVSVPLQVTIPRGTNVVAIPGKGSLSVSGKLQSSIPLLATSTGGDNKPLDNASLDAVVRELGMLPNAQTRLAVASLTAENLPVTRANLNSLITSAGAILRLAGSEDYEAAPIMRAVAHQIAWDLPIIPALTRGITAMLSPAAGISALLQNAAASLAGAVAAARQPASAPEAIAQNSATTAEAGLPPAENAFLGEGQGQNALPETSPPPSAAAQTYPPLPEGLVDTLSLISARLAALPVSLGEAASPQTLQTYLGAFAGSEIRGELKNLEGIIHAVLDSRPALRALDKLLAALRPAAGQEPAPVPAPAPGEALPLPAGTMPANWRHEGFLQPLFMKIVNLLPDLSTAERSALQEFLHHELTAPAPGTGKAILARIRPENLPRVMQALAGEEESLIHNDPVLSHLADAHHALRSLGERAAAYKAVNLASSNEDPGLFMAEVPLRFGPQSGESWLRIYYRREDHGQRRRKPWSSRVILDLNTSNLGAIVGDVRFFPTSLNVIMATADEAAVAALASEQDQLSAALTEKGFSPKLEFRALVIESEAKPADRNQSALRLPPKRTGGELPHLDIQV